MMVRLRELSQQSLFLVLLFVFVAVIGVHWVLPESTLFRFSSDSRSGFLTGAVVTTTEDSFSPLSSLTPTDVANATQNCYQYTSQSNCQSHNCNWKTSGSYSWCQDYMCSDADSTNQTHCEALNTTYNLSFGCTWTAGSLTCSPAMGNYKGDSCSDYNNDQNGCYATTYCFWNSTSSGCQNPSSTAVGPQPGGREPGCGVLKDQTTCINISGCSWDGTACNGNTGGLKCSYINKSICSSVTFLSSCCSWNGSICGVSYDHSCYNNIPSLPVGATFCDDSKSFKNQTVCSQIAGSPWYMPCAWNNVTNECHFDTASYGGGEFASFDEIGTELGCEAQGGIWKSEQWADTTGITRTDSWCEFNFGKGGNCDSACWACEKDTRVSSDRSAENICVGSALGYCQFQADSHAPNGFGWCNPKTAFIEAGGKSVNDACSAADFLADPPTKCVGSTKGCIWVNDSSSPNGQGYCFGQNEKRCANDCFSCYDSGTCATSGKGGNGACAWDSLNLFCKPAGFTGEVCFDGKDNDNDAKTDCSDPDCGTDKFCGGSDLSGSLGNCPSFTPQGNATCVTNGCRWVKNSFESNFGSASAGFCDFPGAQCPALMNSSNCNADTGCSWNDASGSFCSANTTLFNSCFPQTTSTACTVIPGCGWVTDTYNANGGRCEPLVFNQCFGNETRRTNQSNCEANVTVSGQSTQPCSWSTDVNSPRGGFCNPVCFSLTVANCVESRTHGLCELPSGFCEPKAFTGKCPDANGNITQCNGALNSTCSYINDLNAHNGLNGTAGNISGWCGPKGAVKFMNFLGKEEPVIIGTDSNESTVSDDWDIQSLGLRDDFDRMVFGTRVYDTFATSGVCNNVAIYSNGSSATTLGTGNFNHTFYWYFDTDGNTGNSCATRDNSSMSGFEFSFKYQDTLTSSLSEVKIAYRCVNGTWGSTPIPLTTDKQKMCGVVGGAMVGIDKQEIFKFKSLFNKSADLRVYATVNNITNNDSIILDVAGPYYYSPGSVDFKFEDCANPGSDADGDGLSASNDPDCNAFNKFGYVPNEVGFQCGDTFDNDVDGQTDCADSGCSFSLECGGLGKPVASVSDKTAPSITWLKVNTFPDAAFVMYDTNEPANGTIAFYNNDSSCKTLNKTIRDAGLYDSFLPQYKLWHDGSVDTSSKNPDAVASPLPNATVFYYKTTICDINNNCAVSSCLNFTTKSSASSCSSCSCTFNFPFTARSGTSSNSSLGNLNFNIILSNGTENNLRSNAVAGSQLNYSQTKNFDLLINNPNATGANANWSIRLINSSVVGKVASSVTNFSAGGGDIALNSTNNGTFVGLGGTKCQELINNFRPKKLELRIPGNHSDLYQCDAALSNCTLKSVGTNATRVMYNQTTNVTVWYVPSEWGC